jgi:hypothetical protein
MSVVVFLPGAELKEKKPKEPGKGDWVELKDDNEDKVMPEFSGVLSDIPYNSNVHGFILHGDAEVTLFDSKTKRAVGKDTLHFHMNLGMKMVGMEDLAPEFGNKRFKAEKKDENTYILRRNYQDEKMGELTIEVVVTKKGDLIMPEVNGRMTLTRPNEKPEVKLFKGMYYFYLVEEKDRKK